MKQWCRTLIKELAVMFRKRFGMMLLISSALALAGCGSSTVNKVNNPPQPTGDWTANLLECSGCSPTWSFNLTLAQGSGSTLNLANFDNRPFGQGCCFLEFTQYPGCVTTPMNTEVETDILSSGTLDVTSGALRIGLASPPEVGDFSVSLQGTLTNNVVTGTWTATGAGFNWATGVFNCSVAGSGNFTMTKT